MGARTIDKEHRRVVPMAKFRWSLLLVFVGWLTIGCHPARVVEPSRPLASSEHKIEVILRPLCGAGEGNSIEVTETIWWPKQDSPLPLSLFRPLSKPWVKKLSVSPQESGLGIEPSREGGVELLHIRPNGSDPVVLKFEIDQPDDGFVPVDEHAESEFRHDRNGWTIMVGNVLAAPPLTANANVTIRWDLSCTPHARMIATVDTLSSIEFETSLTWAGALEDVVFRELLVANEVHLFSSVGSEPRVEVTVVGQPPGPLDEIASWLRSSFEVLAKYFGDVSGEGLRVVLRPYQKMPSGYSLHGVNLGTILLEYGAHVVWGATLKKALLHEMVHRWIGRTIAVADEGDESARWFSEGLTEYISLLLFLEDTKISREEAVGAINDVVDTLQMSLLRNIPDRMLGRAQSPDKIYSSRGALYAAELDSALREHGLSFDAIVQRIVSRARHERSPVDDGKGNAWRMPREQWEQEIFMTLGSPGVERFREVIQQGSLPSPPSDAFGDCFERTPWIVFALDLGFEPTSLTTKIVHGLTEGSPAQRAGVADGSSVELVSVQHEKVTVLSPIPSNPIRYEPAWTSYHGSRWVAKKSRELKCRGMRFAPYQ